MKEADIIIIPSTEAIYVHRQSRDFLNEVAKAVSCDAIIVSHEWLIECGIAFTLLPTDPYDFADDQSHGKSSESVVESSMELVKEHTPQLADEPALELGHCFSEDTDTASSSSSSCSDIIHADTSADLDDPDSEPDVPLRFVCGRRTESQSPQKRVIRDVYDYESSLSPDPEQPKPLPKPKKRPFPFHILMKKRTSQPRADRNRPTVDARDSEAYEMLVELLEERCMKEGFTRVSGKQLCRSLDVEVRTQVEHHSLCSIRIPAESSGIPSSEDTKASS